MQSSAHRKEISINFVNLNGEGWELYNLAQDPTELNNLAEANSERLRELLASYEEWKLGIGG
ncbi:MAG: hypothetical protein KTR26_12685 [Flammeovirgaceae bacterium]|nr:hypothetical protein [Flammeovirgaceae bacterium]